MYAIIIEFDPESLSKTYPAGSCQNAYDDIQKVLDQHGFTYRQGGVYFGDATKVNAVSCVLAVMSLASECAWFEPSVRDIRMLRIEDISDLMPAVKDAAAHQRLRGKTAQILKIR